VNRAVVVGCHAQLDAGQELGGVVWRHRRRRPEHEAARVQYQDVNAAARHDDGFRQQRRHESIHGGRVRLVELQQRVGQACVGGRRTRRADHGRALRHKCLGHAFPNPGGRTRHHRDAAGQRDGRLVAWRWVEARRHHAQASGRLDERRAVGHYGDRARNVGGGQRGQGGRVAGERGGRHGGSEDGDRRVGGNDQRVEARHELVFFVGRVSSVGGVQVRGRVGGRVEWGRPLTAAGFSARRALGRPPTPPGLRPRGDAGVGATGRARAPNRQWRVCLPPGAARPRRRAASTDASGAVVDARG